MSKEIQVSAENIPGILDAVNNKDAFEHAQRVAKMLSASDLIPKRFQGSVQNTMIALELSQRLKASPIMVMQNLYIVHGSPAWSGQFSISAINSCGRFHPLEFDLQGEGDKLRCRAYAEDKRTGKIKYGSWVTFSMAKAEGWVDKPGSKWKTMPDQMVMYRSASFFARVHCPEVLNGMYTIEEVEDYTVMSDASMDAYIERLIDSSTYDDDSRSIMLEKVVSGITKEEGQQLILDLQNNQLDPVKQGKQYSVTDAKEATRP